MREDQHEVWGWSPMAGSRASGLEETASTVLERLQREYPGAGPRLQFNNPYQALAATILSAQTTDRSVNLVTPRLFARYPDLDALSSADVEDVAGIIRSVGLFRMKAAHLVASARQVAEEHGGRIPDTLEGLLQLPGVGRKTANVVLANAFGKPGLGVDTHVHRVANRIGLATSRDPAGTERRLKEIIPEEDWSRAHHLLIFHGRQACRAGNPHCSNCALGDLCGYFHRRTEHGEKP